MILKVPLQPQHAMNASQCLRIEREGKSSSLQMGILGLEGKEFSAEEDHPKAGGASVRSYVLPGASPQHACTDQLPWGLQALP